MVRGRREDWRWWPQPNGVRLVHFGSTWLFLALNLSLQCGVTVSNHGRVEYTSQTVSLLVPNPRVIFNIDYTFCLDVSYKKHGIRGSQHIGQRLSLNTQQPCTSQPPQRRISFDQCYHVSYYTIPSILSSTGTLGNLDTEKLVYTNAGSNGTKCSTRQTYRNTTARVWNPIMQYLSGCYFH